MKFKYVINWFHTIYRMTPRARRWGIRYYWDRDFRKRMRSRERGAHNRKIRGSGFLSSVTHRKNMLAKRRGKICVSCGIAFPLQKLTVDHIVKVSNGGSNEYSNLQLLCLPCHRYKDCARPKNTEFANKPFTTLLQK